PSSGTACEQTGASSIPRIGSASSGFVTANTHSSSTMLASSVHRPVNSGVDSIRRPSPSECLEGLIVTRETYDRERAENYERRRSGSLTWRREQEIVESFLALADPSPGSSVLDVPVGTGRFNDLYQTFRLRTIGIDISADMLA